MVQLYIQFYRWFLLNFPRISQNVRPLKQSKTHTRYIHCTQRYFNGEAFLAASICTSETISFQRFKKNLSFKNRSKCRKSEQNIYLKNNTHGHRGEDCKEVNPYLCMHHFIENRFVWISRSIVFCPHRIWICSSLIQKFSKIRKT